jgi:hypothetical protein
MVLWLLYIDSNGRRDKIIIQFKIAELEVGQLVHLESFTLFDAMSAIEIMDPKMDTGMILEGDKKIPFNPLKSLSGEQVLWVIDRLLCCEVRSMCKHMKLCLE